VSYENFGQLIFNFYICWWIYKSNKESCERDRLLAEGLKEIAKLNAELCDLVDL